MAVKRAYNMPRFANLPQRPQAAPVEPKRRRKVLRDNIQGITKPAIRRLARRGGVKRISGLVYEETRGVLKVFLESVIRDAVTYTEHARRKTLTAMDVVYALKRQGRTLYGFGDAPPPRTKPAKKKSRPTDPIEIAHVPKTDPEYRSIITEDAAMSQCNAYGVSILEPGDMSNVLDLGSGVYVAREDGEVAAFLVYISPGANGYPASFSRLTWRGASGRVGAGEASRMLRDGAGAASNARIGEILLMCKRRGAAGGVARRLLDEYMQRLRAVDVVYAGATRGELDGRSPTLAWQRLGFTHLEAPAVQEGQYAQDVMVRRVA
jgi:histone H4